MTSLTPTERRKNTFFKSNLKNQYSLTLERYDEFKIRQRGVCPGCGKSLDEVKPTVDHVHDETKRVRGILCNSCNLTIGHAHENPEVLRALAEYLDANGHI